MPLTTEMVKEIQDIQKALEPISMPFIEAQFNECTEVKKPFLPIIFLGRLKFVEHKVRLENILCETDKKGLV